MRPRDLGDEVNDVSAQVISAALEVHSLLGPGLLEMPYRVFLAQELRRRGVAVEEEVALPVEYKGARVELGHRIDLLVEGRVIVEVKAVQDFHPRHVAQVMTYLKLAACPLAILLNFHEPHLRDGIRRIVRQE